MRQRIWGRDFPNPIGVAAGFDKEPRAPDALLRLGFGFAETGTVTPRPQPGNPKPRIFRLYEDGRSSTAWGSTAAVSSRRWRGCGRGRGSGSSGSISARTATARTTPPITLDGVRRVGRLADYFVINVSSPNTPGLRDLQRREILDDLLRRVVAARDDAAPGTPLLVKIAPDLTPEERADIAALAGPSGIDGIVIANTTVARPAGLGARRRTSRAGSAALRSSRRRPRCSARSTG